MGHISADQRRQDFIDAAVSVISEQGLNRATTRRIAEVANAPLATLHYCFQTKEQLYMAVFQAQVDTIGQRIGDVPVSAGLSATVVATLRSSVDWLTRHRAHARAQFDLYLWAMRQTSGRPSLAENVYQIFFDRLVRVFQDGLLPTDDPDLVEPLARMVICVVDGMILNWVARPDGTSLDAELALFSESVALLVDSRVTAGNPTC